MELEETYNAAADHCDYPPVSFWDRYGQRTVDRLPLIFGMAVLDVCFGLGASAIPTAERVGPNGKVVAVDLADAAWASSGYFIRTPAAKSAASLNSFSSG